MDGTVTLGEKRRHNFGGGCIPPMTALGEQFVGFVFFQRTVMTPGPILVLAVVPCGGTRDR